MAQWKYWYFDPELKNSDKSTWKEIQTPEESDSCKIGDIVEVWDHVFRWNEKCIPNNKMLEWRIRGDSLADAALPILTGPSGDAGGTDLIARLEAAATKPDPAPEVTAMWQQVNTIDSVSWPPREQFERGQAVFFRYAPLLLGSLLHSSLSGGFSSPRISRVLNLASYLTPPMSTSPEGEAPRITPKSNNRSYLRLMETTQFVIDCMGKGAMEIGGKGWASTIRVRLLHTTMRRRLLEKSRTEWQTKGYSIYNEKTDGIPISQEDMIGTLSSFSAIPLACLGKAGCPATLQECEDYTALWRVIGYYLGVENDVLRNHHTNFAEATSLLASFMVTDMAGESDPPPSCQFPFQENLVKKQQEVVHVVNKNTNEDPYTAPATLPILLCICNRWPIPFSFPQHCAATRQLIGPTLSDWLSVPKTGLKDQLEMRFGYFLSGIPPRFARVYRKGWDEARRRAMERSVRTAISIALGLRETKFRPRGPDQFTPTKEGDEFYGESRATDIRDEFRAWGILYAEMALVVGIGSVLALIMSPILVPVLLVWFLVRS